MSLDADLSVATAAARAAGSFAQQFFGRRVEVRSKGAPGDVVTEADIGAEAVVRELLARERPGDGLLGEEGSSADGERRWLIDAIDGTLNFVHGDPFWCSAVALEDKLGGAVAAVHHVASGETFTARRGGGCWLNDRPLQLRSEVTLAESVLATYLHPGDGRTATFQKVLGSVASMRARGSGTLELAWLAAGRVDAWLQLDVFPWDLVPGTLLVSEAGGVCGGHATADGAWSFATTSSWAARDLATALQG